MLLTLSNLLFSCRLPIPRFYLLSISRPSSRIAFRGLFFSDLLTSMLILELLERLFSDLPSTDSYFRSGATFQKDM